MPVDNSYETDVIGFAYDFERNRSDIINPSNAERWKGVKGNFVFENNIRCELSLSVNISMNFVSSTMKKIIN